VFGAELPLQPAEEDTSSMNTGRPILAIGG
jgi:hypothetical protein